MRLGLRGVAVVGTAAAALLVSVQPAAFAKPAPATHVTVVNSCSQRVAPGRLTCFALRRSDLGFTSRARVAASPQATPSGYGPSSLQSAYKLPSSSAGAGQRVYIVDAYDDPNAESDLAAYRSQYGLAACTTANGCFKKLNQNGASSPLPSPDTGWAGEISLDLDMASAICPKCGITLLESNDNGTNLYVAIKEAATLGAKFVSMSFGSSEFNGETSLDSSYFKPTGIVYAASTGDSAYQAGISYPAASPGVVAVGGTSLHASSNARGWTESVWKTSNTSGTGSGCSSYEAKPSWQSAVVPSATCAKRADSDVSAVADPATGVAVYQTYGGSGWAVYGGTSASAPIVASTYALAGAPAATAKPGSFPYAHTGNLFDVTSGNNGSCAQTLLCTAATGWDGPTGLGTPNGVAAFRAGTSGGTCSGQKLQNRGFESGTANWNETANVIATDGQAAHSGVGYAYLDGYGVTHTDYISQSVTLPASCTATLTYYLWVDSTEGTTTALDKFSVSVNGTAVQNYSNRNQTAGYVKKTVDLSAYAGQTVTLKFTGTENNSNITAFLVDDTALTIS